MRNNGRHHSFHIFPSLCILFLLVITVFSRTPSTPPSSTNTLSSPTKSKKYMNQLMEEIESSDDLIEATTALKLFLQNSFHEKEPKKFQQASQKIGNLVITEFNRANDLSNRKKFSQSADIYKTVLDQLGGMLDPTNRRFCQDQYAEMVYRLALGGNRQWTDLEDILLTIEQRTPYQEYLLHFAQTNIKNKRAKWKAAKDTYRDSETLPYVLRFHMPQKYHTPTLAHFGHVSPLSSPLFLDISSSLF
jgi:hypothetical protein